MSKKRIEHYIPRAYEVIKSQHTDIATEYKGDYEVLEGLKGQIASFGSAVNMGNLKSAVAFFSDKGGAQTDRQNLMKAIYLIINEDKNINNKDTICTNRSLFEQIQNIEDYEISSYKGKILDAAVAVKLAIRMCKLVDKKTVTKEANKK